MGQSLGGLLGALQGDLMEQGVFVKGDDPRPIAPIKDAFRLLGARRSSIS